MSRLSPLLAVLLVALAPFACGEPSGGAPDASQPDASLAPDAGESPDAGEVPDAGSDPERSGESCEEARIVRLVSGTPLVLAQESTTGTSDDFHPTGNGCDLLGTQGYDRVYEVQVPAHQVLRAAVKPLGGTYDPLVAIVEAPAANCTGEVACLDADDRGLEDAENVAHALNDSNAAKTVYLVVDSSERRGGSYRLELLVHELPEGDRCTGAPSPRVPATLTAQSFTGFDDDYRFGEGCRGTTGPERVYALHVPAGRRLRAVATPTSGLDVSLSVVTGAASACEGQHYTCAASADAVQKGKAETLLWNNTGASEEVVFLLVDATAAAPTGTFDLALTIEDSPAGDTCESATPITAPVTITGDTTVGYANDYVSTLTSPGCTLATGGPDRAYSLAVPDGRTLEVRLTPASGFDASLTLVTGAAEACGARPRTCTASDDSGRSGAPDHLTWTNTTGAAQQAFVIVDAATAAGSFDLDVTLR